MEEGLHAGQGVFDKRCYSGWRTWTGGEGRMREWDGPQVQGTSAEFCGPEGRAAVYVIGRSADGL